MPNSGVVSEEHGISKFGSCALLPNGALLSTKSNNLDEHPTNASPILQPYDILQSSKDFIWKIKINKKKAKKREKDKRRVKMTKKNRQKIERGEKTIERKKKDKKSKIKKRKKERQRNKNTKKILK